MTVKNDSKSSPIIEVYFSNSADDSKPFCKQVGNLSLLQFNKLQKKLEQMTIPSNACINRLTISFQQDTSMGCVDLTYKTHMMFITDIGFRRGKHECQTAALPGSGMNAEDNLSSIKACYNHFSQGKCKCPVMGGILGKTILPNLYDKQKTK